MEKRPTAEEFLFGKADSFDHQMRELTFTDAKVKSLIIEFAKLHVKAALEAASENATAYREEDMRGGTWTLVDKDSVINSYPLDNIK